MNLFTEKIEQQAIERIQKFAKIAKTMGFEVCLGFSGGKDSQVCYDLCKRSGIEFKAYYNVAFESNVTKCFIREYYPDVIWRRASLKTFGEITEACCRPFKSLIAVVTTSIITTI